MTPLEALSDPVRRKILELLRDGGQTSGEISSEIGRQFGISQSAVSQHLKVLRDVNLVSSTPKGAKRIYHLEPYALRELAEWINSFSCFWQAAFDKLSDELREELKISNKTQNK